ncbi:MAG: outer membrane lipoprotein carrier protein LolA [Desulfofustis sp.]|jgi:outer membrane lipoprotein carrier protein|nr:outer membrane lipoprotein carrier protein LolA [Desulfofustis sp.]
MTLLSHARRLAVLPAIFLLLTLLLPPLCGGADGETAELVVQRLQVRYQQLTSLRFQFDQQTSGQFAGRPKIGSGSGILVNNEQQTLMRWNYDNPDQQVVISDGVSVSMYFKDLNQMIIAPADTAQTDVLLSFFTGDRGLGETFLILPPEERAAAAATEQGRHLSGAQLVPRQPHTQLRGVHLFIDDDSLIRRIDMMDHFDTRTIIDFTSIDLDPIDLQDEAAIEQAFSFTPPPGTEIIRQQ